MRELKQFCALAGCAWRESVRMKVFLVLVLFAACAMLLSPFLPTDGTPQGRLKIAVSACMWSAALFATLMAVVLPALLVSREHDTRTIFVLATKPVLPGMIVLGKVGGAVLVGAVFLGAGGCLTWVVAHALAWGSPQVSDDCLVMREALRPVRETGAFLRPLEVRAGGVLFFPLPPGTHQAVLELKGRGGERVRVGFPKANEEVAVVLREEGARLPVPSAALGEETVEVRLTPPGAAAHLRAGRVAHLAPGEEYEWEFALPERASRPREALEVRGAGGVRLKVRAYAGMTVSFTSTVEMKGEGWSQRETVKFRPDRPSMLRLPAGAEGKLRAVLVNESTLGVRVVEGQSAELLVPTGSFAGALVKDFLGELSTFIFIALGTAMVASFSSFPMAACWGLFLAVAGQMSGMVREVVSRPALIVHEGHTHGEHVPGALNLLVGLVARVTPDLSAHDATEAIVGGAYFPWTSVIAGLFVVAVLRGGACGALGWFIYSRRELGS